MTIEAGQTLGHYRLTEKIGEGGMGEVWLAHDARLGRDVAVKVLPPGFAEDEQYLARFEREGQAISALNHPNICTLFDIGHEGETHFLVMERIEGESLADRLEKGPLPMEQVIETGAQIASALAAAHRAGIVHRDLKPGNVMLTREGAKLLDFGLAKSAADASPLSGLSEAPTQHQPLTQQGMILGTFQYMAPEQLEGLDADARTDNFALGAVLYEMASGRKAFEGSNKTSLIAAIVSSQPPPISELQPMTPPAFEHVVRKCLEKDPENRWQSAGDVAAQLQWISTQSSQSGVAPAVPGRRRSPWRLLPWVAAVVMAIIAGLLALDFATRSEVPQPVYRATLAPPPGTALTTFDELGLALSSDGKRLAFVAFDADGGKTIWIRDLDTMIAEPLLETAGAWYPFWSPDGQHLGYFADGSLMILDLRGGSPRALAEASSGRGGTWSQDDIILFAPKTRSAIYRIPSQGGTPEAVTAYDPERDVSNRWPHFLPDGEHFVYVSRASDPDRGEVSQLMLSRLGSMEPRMLIENSTNALYVDPGFLIFGRAADLMAQRFDAQALELGGEPIPLSSEKLSFWEPKNFVPFAASDRGTIVYLPDSIRQTVLQWYDRDGRPLEPVGQPGFFLDPRISPDGTRLTWVEGRRQDLKSDVWVHDIEFDRSRRLTLESGTYGLPVWSPDGNRIAFQCQPKRVQDVCVAPVDEAGEVEILYESDTWTDNGNWTAAGLIFQDQSPDTDQDIWIVDTDEANPPRVLLQTPFTERLPELSPDGRWFAYVSNETGRDEVYIRETRVDSLQWQISTAGGENPRWRGDGREVYFNTPAGDLMAVAVETEPVFRAAPPQVLFGLAESPDRMIPPFGDVSADGERFILNLPLESRGSLGFHAIFNWTSLLEP